MAFSNAIDSTEPLGSAAVKNGAAELRQLKGDIIERLNSVFVDCQADPLTLRDGTVTTTKIADAGITTAKIADGAITGPKINGTTLASLGKTLGTINTGRLQNATGTRYIDTEATLVGDYFLRHPALSLFGDGTAAYAGVVTSDVFNTGYAKFAGTVSALTDICVGKQDTTYNGTGTHDFSLYGLTSAGVVGATAKFSNVNYSTAAGTNAGLSSTYGLNLAVGELYVGGYPVAKVKVATTDPSGAAAEGTIWIKY